MQRISAEHTIVCDLQNDAFGYFGWPTVTRAYDGTLWCVASGMRTAHVCPNGRTTLFRSSDNGRTWSTPRVIHDSPFDVRDAGILDAGDGRLLVSWFTSNPLDSSVVLRREEDNNYPDNELYRAGLEWPRAYEPNRFIGSWIMASDDGGATWDKPHAVDVDAPHGPIRLASGDLLYLGKVFDVKGCKLDAEHGPIRAICSNDRGETWRHLGDVPLADDTHFCNYHEPHVVELPGGKLLGHIRIQSVDEHSLDTSGIPHFSIMQTVSDDGGITWTKPASLGFHGSPPHLLRHSSGTLVCSYGYRQEGYGQRIAISRDEGQTWQHDLILRDDGPGYDLGYPSTVELSDGSLLSVYYQQTAPDLRCALLASRWLL